MLFNKLTKKYLILLPVFILLMGCGNTKTGSDITEGLIYDENDNTSNDNTKSTRTKKTRK